MSDSRTEENTQWIATWVLNDPDMYYHATDAAFHSTDKLEKVVTDFLKSAGENTVAGYIHAEMRGNDYDYVNWEEIREALLS